MTRDEARQLFTNADLGYSCLTPVSIRRLRRIINEKMKESGLIGGSFRCLQRGLIHRTNHGKYAEIRCKSNYFDGREAVSFNTDGFIGFAGWADAQNVRPILAGFAAWVKEVANKNSESVTETFQQSTETNEQRKG